MASKSYIYNLRIKLGLTLEELSTLIQCSFGQLAMAEADKRKLPTQSLLLLSQLELSLTEAEKEQANPADDTTALQAMYQKHIKVTQAKRSKLELTLDKLTHKTKALQTLLKTIAVWSATELPTDSDLTHLQMQVLARKSRQKLKQIRLQIAEYKIRIAGLSAEIAEAEQYANFGEKPHLNPPQEGGS